MIEIDAKADKASLKNVLNMLSPAHRNASLFNALNVTARAVRKAANIEVKRFYAIKANKLARSTKVIRAKRGRPQAEYIAKSERISLIHFSPKKAATGTKVTVRRGRPGLIKHGFIQTMQKGKHVWKRKGKARLPVTLLRGASVAYMTKKAAEKKIRKVAGDFHKVFHDKVHDKIQRNRKKALKYLAK